MVQRRWVRAAPASEVPPGRGASVRVAGQWYALFQDLEGRFFATDDACPHEGTPLGDGSFHDGRVICSSHDWVFDVRSGACLNVSGAKVACYATRRVGDDVEIEIEVAAFGAE